MYEFIGTCKTCEKGIYCENGFLNGVLLPGHEYLCYDCDEKLQHPCPLLAKQMQIR